MMPYIFIKIRKCSDTMVVIYNYNYIGAILTKVSFDDKNIIHIHPKYIKLTNEGGKKYKIDKLKYVLWSIGMLILRYVYHINIENLKIFHKEYMRANVTSFLREFNVYNNHFEFLQLCFNYKEEDFSKFYYL